MEAKELRIGNLVSYKGKVITVDSVCNEGINIISDYEEGYIAEFKLKDLEPIPLTGEWLIKFGFTYSDSIWFKNNIEISSWFTFRFGSSPFRILEINYIHQLQNLYFALTD